MALSNSERQKRYRTVRLGAGGKHERISCLVPIPSKRNLERLAAYFGCTITGLIVRLIDEKTAEVMNSLDDEGRQRFFAQATSEKQDAAQK
ncbi:hypothetical protein BTHE68_40370 [Burkholderia sp. THE68]|uniref:hypothetical protein n=1 Tax=Burkholderia sp. THE68 TaxID=758782 RepID=UPI0013196760|nr:hypothetical protein [Burkholderia sp. THE68]BBU30303.1 hypothetical protein BTHE68_40370 [Burkholderia sp. THE68]